jgi:NAD(P)-dependent dehydrogenase (short-subunit alcohol dehydrogenase family)
MTTGAFEGQLAVVTGAGSGIGAATARRLAADGASVIVADVDETSGMAVADAVGGRFTRLDVGDPEAWDALVAEAGPIRFAHLNAGIAMGAYPVRIERSSIDAYRRVMRVNADGVFFGARALVPGLAERGGGAIVATASLAGLGPHADDPVYSATKHFVVGLVRSLAPPLADLGITINAVCPGGVATALLRTIGHPDPLPDQPFMDPVEIADAVATLLAGDETGEAYMVRAGRGSERFVFPGQRRD